MSEIFKICASAVVSLFAVLILRQTGSPYGELAAVLFGICIMARVAVGISEALGYLRTLADGSLVQEHLSTLLKAAAIAFITDLTADICRDTGVGSLASYVELFGRCELVLLSLPLVSELLELAFALLRL